jgi:hypothetical protein
MEYTKVERDGIEYNASIFEDIHQTCDELNADNFTKWLPSSVVVKGNWYVAHGDYLIFDDNYELVDVRSMNAFLKMYDIQELIVPDVYEINVSALKEYITNLSTEKDEFWVAEQRFVADEISNILRILNVPGYRDFDKFANSLVD